MKFKSVFRFEFQNLIRKKSFIITTIVLMVVAFIAISIPKIIGLFSFSPSSLSPDYGIVLEESSNLNYGDLKSFFPDGRLFAYNDREELVTALNEETIGVGYVVTTPTSYEEIFQDRTLSELMSPMDQALQNLAAKKSLEEHGYSYEEIRALENVEIQSETTIMGKDSQKNFGHVYFYIMLIYMMVLMYGTITATSVAREKNDRTMELLVTYTDTNSLIFGKVLATVLTGILQILCIGLAAFSAYMLWGYSGAGLGEFLSIDGKMIGIYLLFGLTGYFFLMFIYAALGSLVSRIEDVNSAVTPIMIIIIVGFFVSMASLAMPGNAIVKVASYVPITSFFAMPLRNAMGSVTLIENLISYVILLLFAFLTMRFSARVYRFGTIYYGNKIRWRALFHLDDY